MLRLTWGRVCLSLCQIRAALRLLTANEKQSSESLIISKSLIILDLSCLALYKKQFKPIAYAIKFRREARS